MTLQRDEHPLRLAWKDAQADLLGHALTVADGRERGTLTTKELDELRDAGKRYKLAVKEFLSA